MRHPFLQLGLLGALGCGVTAAEGPMGGNEPPPPTSVAQGVGYDNAVRLGAAWAQHQGYQASLAEAGQQTGRLWVLHYAVVKDGKKAHLHLTVDPAFGTVTPAPLVPLRVEKPDAPAPGVF